jgi:hypothetical protein
MAAARREAEAKKKEEEAAQAEAAISFDAAVVPEGQAGEKKEVLWPENSAGEEE